MKMELMRKIDYYLGMPICYLFAFFEMFKRLLFFRNKHPGDIKKILIIKFLGIGSISLVAPTIVALKNDFPQAKIYFLTFKNNEEVIKLLNLTHQNFFINTKNLYQFFKSTVGVLFQLRKEKIDIALDLEFFSKFPLVISFLGGIKKKAGFYLTQEWWRKYLLDYLGYYNHYFHIKDIFLSLAYLVRHDDPYYRAFDRYQKKYTLPILSIYPDLLNKVKAKLSILGASDDRAIIVINPNAGPELTPHLKRWPPEHFAQLIERLNHNYKNISIILTGSHSERPYVQSIIEKTNISDSNAVINFAGETSLQELLGLLSLSNIFITVDSGPMHLASLLRIPTVGLFGAETPTLYAPLNERATVLCKQLYSVPMFTVYNGKQSTLTENIPLQLITVDEVYEHVEKYMNNYPILCIASFVNQLISNKSE